jgi:glycosyltransferase involved in cell wall biosynthesis
MSPLISICIPAYRQPALLERCLASIAMQTYKQVEVLISDDTPGNAVKIVVDRFTQQLPLQYTHNDKPLGTPANWNAALQMAKGDYLLLLHHDDAFSTPESLSLFLAPFQNDSTVDFVFGRNPTIQQLSAGKHFSPRLFLDYYADPECLITGNTIGAPSNVMLKAATLEQYNENYKWIVDIEMYVRLFRKKRKFFYVDKELISIGIHEGQVSNECVDNNDVLLFENISFAMDRQFKIRTWKLYDFYWRLLRNAGVRSVAQLTKLNLAEKDIPAFIRHMIRFQRKVPAPLLQQGLVSKLLMGVNYTFMK